MVIQIHTVGISEHHGPLILEIPASEGLETSRVRIREKEGGKEMKEVGLEFKPKTDAKFLPRSAKRKFEAKIESKMKI